MNEYTEDILTTQMISGKLIKEVDETFQKLGYKVDMFLEFFIISGTLATKEEIIVERVLDDALEKYEVQDEDEDEFIGIHLYYHTLITNFYLHMLDDDRNDDSDSVLMDKMQSLSSALFHQLPMTLLPTALFKSIENIIPALVVVFESYDIDMQSKDILQQVKNKMGPFVHEKVDHFFMVITQLTKDSKKLKRVNKEMTHHAKFAIMNFIIVCWDVMLRYEDD